MNIRNSADVIRACAETSSRTEKIALLKKYDSDKLRFILRMAVSPFEVFGVKEVAFASPIGGDEFNTNWQQMTWGLNQIRGRSVRSGTVREFITELSKHFNADQQEVLRWILEKDLRAGIGVAVVNAAFPGLIPEFDVQLAKTLDMSKVVFPCFTEIKRDGQRNLAFVINGTVLHYSRNGKEKDNFHIFDEELIAIAKGNDMVFDGEVCGVREKGEDNRSERRKVQQQAQRKYDVDAGDLVFIVFDMFPVGAFKLGKVVTPLKLRQAELRAAVVEFKDNSQQEKFRVRMSKVTVVETPDKLNEVFGDAVLRGHEGLIVKDPNSKYEFKRSWIWQKMKPTETGDYKIVDIREGKKGREGTVGSLVVDVDGVSVRCGVGGGISIAECQDMWNKREELIGKTAEVKYLCTTLDGSLLGAKFVKIREDK